MCDGLTSRWDCHIGGRGGIRTHGGFNPTLDFESSALNRTQPPFRCKIDEDKIDKRSNRSAVIIKRGVFFANQRPRLIEKADAKSVSPEGEKRKIFLLDAYAPPYCILCLSRLPSTPSC